MNKFFLRGMFTFEVDFEDGAIKLVESLQEFFVTRNIHVIAFSICV